MIAYNITYKILPVIETAWVAWLQQEHIPGVMASGQFTEYKFFRLLEQDEADGITYIVQYFASSLERYHAYIEKTAPLFRQKALDRWGDKFIAFRTVMEVVH
jgi:Domain of unknown function (DUF4286)